MHYKEVKEAEGLLEVLDFAKLCRRPVVYSNSEALALKSYTSGTPEFKLPPAVQDVVLNAIESYALGRLAAIGVEPDPEAEREEPREMAQ